MTPEQEAQLGKAMADLARSENQRCRSRWGGSGTTNRRQYNQTAAKLNGAKGGRPKTGNNAKMTDRAATINRMLLRGMNAADIADILGSTKTSILDAKRRYSLPREEGR